MPADVIRPSPRFNGATEEEFCRMPSPAAGDPPLKPGRKRPRKRTGTAIVMEGGAIRENASVVPRTWREAAEILASSSSSGGKPRIKVLDTVFVDESQQRRPSSSSSFRAGKQQNNPYVPSSSSLPPPPLSLWVFTSRKGEPSRRKNVDSLDWSHVRERFGRFALANPANARGPRIVAVCRGCGGGGGRRRIHLTAEQFEREVKSGVGGSSGGSGVLGRSSSAQCYLRPYRGRDRIYRAAYNRTTSPPGEEPQVDLLVVEEGAAGAEDEAMAAVLRLEDAAKLAGGGVGMGTGMDEGGGVLTSDEIFAVGREAETAVRAIAKHFEEAMAVASRRSKPTFSVDQPGQSGLQNPADPSETATKETEKDSGRLASGDPPRIATATADFILDDNKQLWLCHVSNVTALDDVPHAVVPAPVKGNKGSRFEASHLGEEADMQDDAHCAIVDGKAQSDVHKQAQMKPSIHHRETKLESNQISPDKSRGMVGPPKVKLITDECPHSEHGSSSPTIEDGCNSTSLSPDEDIRHMPQRVSPPLKGQQHLSAAERDYMDRKGVDASQVRQDGGSGSGMNAEHYKEVIRSLRERIAALEDGLRKERRRASGSSQAATDAKRRAQDLVKELANSRKKHNRDTQLKDAKHEHDLLDLGSQLNSGKAEIARLTSLVVQLKGASSKGSGAAGGGGNDESEMDKSLHEDLLAKIDALHQELTHSQRKWGEERRSMASAHAAAEQERAARHRAELSEQRTATTALEDEIGAEKERVRDAEKDKLVLMQKLADSVQREDSLTKDAERLKSELSLLKQSLEVARDAADSPGTTTAVPDGSVNGSPKVQATADARIRTLNNKIEYLKAQLASEATVKEEYTATIARVRQEKEVLMSTHRARLNELEARKDQQIAQVQDKLRESVEKPMKEVSQLQSKLADLQAQLGRAMQDVAEARKEEEMARADVIKEQAHLTIAKEELTAARKDCEEAQDELERLKDANIDAAVNEGVLRRLDNERRYLKNQLQNEVTCKAELLEKIDNAEKDLREAKAAAKAEAEAYEKRFKSARDDHESAVTQLKGSNQVLDAEVKVQRSQLGEIREAYAKTRDQLRLEQASLEQIRASGQRMAEELKAAQEELAHARKVNDAACARHNDNTKVISQSLKKADAFRAQEMSKMQEATHRALQEASGVQREMLRIRELMSVQEAQSMKHLGAQMFASALNRRLTVNLHCAFSIWRRQMALDRANHLAKEETTIQVQSAEGRVREECEEVTRNVVEKMRSFHEENIADLESKLEESRQNDLKEAREDAIKAIESERERSRLLIDEKEAAWEKKEKDIHAHHQAAVARLTREHNMKVDNVYSKTQKKIDDALSEAEASLRERQEIIINDCNKRWEAKFRENAEKHAEEKSIAVAEAKQEAARKMSAQTEEFAEEKARAVEEKAEEVSREAKNETVRVEKKAAQALLDCEAKWKLRVHKAVEEYKEKAESAEQKHSDDLDRQAKEFDIVLEKKLAEATAELERGYQKTLEESRQKEQEHRLQAVKLEAIKWQQAMREIETRMEVECRAHFEKGVQQREERAKKEMEELHVSANDALEKVKQKATENLKQALEESERKLKLATEKAEKDKKEAMATVADKTRSDGAQTLKEAEIKYSQLLEDEKDRLQRQAKDELERAVRKAVETERSATRKLKAEVDSVKMQRTKDNELFKFQMDRLQKEAEDAMGRRIEEAERTSRRKYEVEREQAQIELIRQRDELLQRHNDELEAVKRDSSANAESLVQRVKQEAEEAMQRSLAALSSKHEEEVVSINDELLSLREQNDTLDTKLEEMSERVKDRQTAVEDLEQDLLNDSKQSSFRLLQILALSAMQRERHRKSLQLKDQEISRELDILKANDAAEKQKLVQKLEKSEKIANSFREQQNAVYQTLVNHKRDALLQHKVKSRELSAQLEAVSSQRQELEEKQHKADLQMRKMEDSVRDLERQIQEHSQVSTIQGGRINVAHARRKRRLDEEYEQLLENIEEKREQMTVVDERLKDVLEKKEDLDSKMRSVERSLVEVLVDQQKRLLSLVSTKQHHSIQR